MTTPTSKMEQRLKAMENVFWALCLFSLALCLGLLTFLAVQDHQRIEQNEEIQAFIRDQAVRNGQVSEQIESCTTPGGECFEANRKRTNGVVGDINRVTLLAASCADRDNSQTTAEIRSCVMEQLEREGN